jgi:AcrR family transcriptional regulator
MSARDQAILTAALEAFAERGFDGATIRDVTQRSGASVGSIYHHFGDKEGIAAALYVECLADYQRGALDALRRHPEAERGIKALVRHHLRWVERNPERARFLLERREAEVAAAAEDRVRDLNRQTFAAVGDWIRPHEDAGRIRRMPRELLYAVVIGPAQEYARHWLRDRMSSPLGRAEKVLGEAAWGGVRTKEGMR